ncbi:MAG: YciI family protein [Vulcanimicrobiota bacterium]
MKYLMLIYSDENAWTDDERNACMAESTELCHELAGRGQYLSASPLHPVRTATSVRVRNGKRTITDGPFAETHEQLGGYYLLEVENLDEAIEVATRIPGVKRGTVEIRPVFELPNLPRQEKSQ